MRHWTQRIAIVTAGLAKRTMLAGADPRRTGYAVGWQIRKEQPCHACAIERSLD